MKKNIYNNAVKLIAITLIFTCMTRLVACNSKTAETNNELITTTPIEEVTTEEITSEEVETTEEPFSLIEYVKENYTNIPIEEALVLNKPETSEGRTVKANNIGFTVPEAWTLDTVSEYDTYINLRYKGEKNIKKYFVVKINFFGTNAEDTPITEDEFIEDMCKKIDSFSKEDSAYSRYSALREIEINGYKGYSITNARLTGTYTDIIYFYLYVDGYVYEIYGTYFAKEIDRNIKSEALNSMYGFLSTLEYAKN